MRLSNLNINILFKEMFFTDFICHRYISYGESLITEIETGICIGKYNTNWIQDVHNWVTNLNWIQDIHDWVTNQIFFKQIKVFFLNGTRSILLSGWRQWILLHPSVLDFPIPIPCSYGVICEFLILDLKYIDNEVCWGVDS